MKVKIKRFDKNIPLPHYKTEGAACVDLYSRVEIKIKAFEIEYIPLNIAVEIPKGYWGMLVSRSSTHKQGFMMANGVGVADWDFRGDKDEYLFPAFNFTKKEITINKGTRVAQLMILQYEKVEFTEVDKLNNKNRGGIGSTGNN